MAVFPLDPTACAIAARLSRAGHEALFAGGCVRDLLLGNAPHDWDIATSARPEEIERIFPHTVAVGRAFGVILVVENGHEYEVATFRADAPGGDGRRPDSVTFCSAREDAIRRDFTINGLFLDPDTGRILDYVDGEADLRAGIVRAVGDPEARFLEDHLRLLRGARFAARLAFRIEDRTFGAMREMAGLVRLVSAERRAEEVTRMLTGGRAGDSFRLLEASNLLLHVLPDVACLRGMPQPKQFHPEGDVLAHTLLMLDALPAGCDERLAWAVLLHDVGKPGALSLDGRIRFNNHDRIGASLAHTIMEQFKRSRELIDAVTALVGGHMHLTALPDMRVARRRRAVADPLFPLQLELLRLDCDSSHKEMAAYAYARHAYEEELARPPVLKPILSGADLITMGYAPGPDFKTMLDALVDAQLEGGVETREAAIAFISRTFRRHV